MSFMTTTDRRILLDTNVLIYSVDPSSAEKQEIATEVLEDLLFDRRAVISVQVLGEFFRVSTSGRRIRQPLAQADAMLRMTEFTRSMIVLESRAEHVLDAARIAPQYSMGFWDAVILATAKADGITVMLTEDYDDGRVIEGVRIVNPFAPAFDMALLR